MATLAQGKVACTYAGCNLAFNTVQEMKKHKATYPNHDYCSKCDEDFEDEERLLLHKIKNDDHIVCPVCSLDFKSSAGRDAHIRQFHRAEQSLVCCGCHAVFKSASGLMRHIEDYECSQITPTRLLREQSKKLLIKQALSDGPREHLPIVPHPMDFDDIDGGVKLSPVELYNREAMQNQPRFGEDDPTSSVSALLALKHWPALEVPAGDEGSEDLMRFSPDSRSVVIGNETGIPVVDSGAAESEAVEAGAVEASKPGLFASDFMVDAGQTLRLINGSWDPTRWFNSYSGKYVCPSCGEHFGQMNEFEEHILNESHSKIVAQCPECYRTFKSMAGLIAHCETSSVRCKINEGSRYAQIIDELTGGLIQATGYNEDSTVKYEAGELDLQRTTVIGKDMQRDMGFDMRRTKW